QPLYWPKVRAQQSYKPCLLGHRRQSELEVRQTCPVRARTQGTCRRTHGVIEKGVGLANEWQQLRQQDLRILGLKHVDIPGAHPREIRHSHLALVSAALAEQHLPWLKDAGEGNAVSDVAPAADAQVTGFEVFQADIAF